MNGGGAMDHKMLQSVLSIGETVAVEFKRCGNGIEHATYESVCSFLNRFGGDLFLGIEDDGTVAGIPPKAAPDMVRNFICVVSNPLLFSPTIYLAPELLVYEGRTLIHVHVPPSAEVHSYKKVIYDRVDDADVKVTATSQIAAMYLRKQNIYTEKKIYPYVKTEDLRLDLLPKLRMMAVNNAMGSHPWRSMDDFSLLKSAGLYRTDRVTGEQGYNLACVMLLGKDDVISDIAPAYVTDALLRKVNLDRYDDREVIKTNLIDSYEQLMEFARKHLPDKFFLEEDQRKSLRNIIAREMLVNTLIHREFSSSYIAKFVIEKDRMYVENANRAVGDGIITPENLEPNPKNPIIAAFFRNIGYSDQLGSGVRNLFKYTKFYSGKEPVLKEGDVFRITVPLDDTYSFDSGQCRGEEKENYKSADKSKKNAGKSDGNVGKSKENADKPDENADEPEKNTRKSDGNVGKLKENADKSDESADKPKKNAGKSDESADNLEKNADKSEKSADKPKKNADKSGGNADNDRSNPHASYMLLTGADTKEPLSMPSIDAEEISYMLLGDGGADNTPYILSPDENPNQKSERQKARLLAYVAQIGQITSKEAENLLSVKQRRARAILKGMVEEGILEKRGSYKNTVYILPTNVQIQQKG